MPTLTRRVQVLFSQLQLQQLQAIAEARGESVGALICRAVDEVFLQGQRERRRKAVRQMAAMDLPVADWEQMERESIRWCSVE
jgi:hypothetical protein